MHNEAEQGARGVKAGVEVTETVTSVGHLTPPLLDNANVRVMPDGQVTIKWPLARIILGMGAVLGFIVGVLVGAIL